MTKNEQGLEEIRSAFRAMIRRLEASTDAIPDCLVAKAKVAHIKIFLAHSEKIDDPDKLIDYCLSVLAKMKRSIDGAQLRPDVHNGDGVDLRSILYAGLYQ
ncbi:hypothetical protein ACFIOY_00225 [Bradyrhizobium sp. TZ2]